MWKRIHSNRDPRDTLYSEVRKEFSAYLDVAEHAGKGFLNRHPKTFFGVMVMLIALSMILSFTICRHPVEVIAVHKKTGLNPVQDGFSQIMEATGRIRETLRLKKVVDSISAKKILSPADSLTLDSALTTLQRIHSPTK